MIKHTAKLWERNYPPGQGSRWIFYCPGCKEIHFFPVGTNSGPQWTFNGNVLAPSFTPSLRMLTIKNEWLGKELPEGALDKRPYDPKYWETHCHLILTNGIIQFCSDCPHPLASQSVPMQEIPYEVE